MTILFFAGIQEIDIAEIIEMLNIALPEATMKDVRYLPSPWPELCHAVGKEADQCIFIQGTDIDRARVVKNVIQNIDWLGGSLNVAILPSMEWHNGRTKA